MPAERVSKRRVREILRLKHGCGASDREIARSLSLARSAVALTLERAAAAGLRWPLPATLTDRVLEAMLYAGYGSQQGARRKAEPDWAYVHHELRRPGVMLMLLWQEYRQRKPDGYRYRACRTGSARMSGRSPSWAACRRSSCPTTRRSGSTAPTGTSPASTAPISIWRPITAPRSCRQDTMRTGCSDGLVFKQHESTQTRTIMETANFDGHSQSFVSAEAATLFVSLELSRARWLVTSLSPSTSKISRHSVVGGNAKDLLQLLADFRMKAERHIGATVKVVTIQEIGFDGFWIHRVLESNSIESHVVEAASIAVPRRRRRAKTDTIDGELLLRTLMAFKRGEPRVCAMVVVPSPEEEDRRRLSRERKTMIKERIEHINRIKGLMACQGIAGFEPMRANAREKLGELRTGDGRAIPERMKAEIRRELDRLALLRQQIAEVEAERDALLHAEDAPRGSPGALLLKLRGIGSEFASVLWQEGLYRRFTNRRQLAAYAGLAPSPWRSGDMKKEQGISKSGNARLRTTMIEAAWLWLRHQPGSALSQWFQERVRNDRGRLRRVSIVALARKLLVALWRFTTHGEIPEGASLKAT